MPPSEPTKREGAFRRLLELLGGPVSGRWAIVEAESFLARLDPERPETESYVLSLIEPLAETAETLDPVGLSPDPLVRLADHLRAARRSRSALRDLSPLRQTREALRRRAALLYAYAGAMGAAIKQLSRVGAAAGEREGDILGPEDLPDEGDPQGTAPLERFRRARAEASATALKEELRWLGEHWELKSLGQERNRSRPRHRTWVPVVERLPSWARQAQPQRPALEVGGLQRVALTLYSSKAGQAPSEGENAQDQLWAGLSSNEDRETLTGGPVAAARALLNQEHPALRGRLFEGRVVADWAHLRHEGRSAGLAIGGLFYGAALEEAHRRRRLKLRPQAALTGALAEGGKAKPVSERGLPIKVQAAFFSPLTTLAVPDGQSATAERALESLQETYPHGDLDIVGAGRLRDVLDHRRLTRKVETSRVVHYTQRAWRRKKRVAVVLLIVGLALGLGWALRSPLDLGPASAQFRGSTLTVENASGRVLEELEVGRSLVRNVKEGQAKRPVAFADVTGGQNEELFWGASPGEDARMDVLRAKAVGADTLLWERPLRFEVDFPGKPEVTSPTFGIAGLTAGDLNRDGRPELYALANHRPYFPSLLLGLDPTDGHVNRRYVHPGHLRSGIETADLAGGPAPELLVGGHSNAFGDPVLAVLDPANMAGHAPTRGDYGVGGADLAAHVAYLRFPSTAVQERRPANYPMVWQIRPAPAAKTLEVVTQDGRVPDEGSGRPRVITTLSFGLEPRSVGTDGTYDQLADSLFQRGVLEAVPGPEALRRYGERVRYWTGSGWSVEPSFTSGSGRQ